MPDPITEVSTDSIMGILDDGSSIESPAETSSPEVDAILSPSEPEPVTPAASATPAPAEPSQPAEQAPATPALAPPPDVVFDEEIGPPTVTEQNGEKEWHWKESRARTIYAGYEEARKYREIAATPEEADGHRQRYIDHLAMAADLRSGDPARVDRFLSYWGQQAPTATLAQQLIRSSRTSNPEVYAAMSTEVLADAAERFYKEYAAMSNRGSEEAQRILYGAQLLEWLVKGEFRQSDNIQAPDPTAERLADIQRRENALRQTETQRIQATQQSFRQSTDTEIRRVVSEDIDAALKPIEHLKKDQPLVYNAARTELYNSVRSATGSDQAFNTLFRIKYEEALGKLNDEGRKEIVAIFRQRAARAISAAKAKVINSVGQSVVRQSQQTHQRAEESSDRKEAGGGAPSPSRLPSQLAARDVAGKINEILGI